jgi:hypothetical protein
MFLLFVNDEYWTGVEPNHRKRLCQRLKLVQLTFLFFVSLSFLIRILIISS